MFLHCWWIPSVYSVHDKFIFSTLSLKSLYWYYSSALLAVSSMRCGLVTAMQCPTPRALS